MPHQWTKYELQTLITLLCAGKHIPNVRKGETTAQSYLTVTTVLNQALNGAFHFTSDISHKAVTQKIDELLEHNENAVEIMTRDPARRITRRTMMVWKRALRTHEIRAKHARERRTKEEEEAKEDYERGLNRAQEWIQDVVEDHCGS